MNALWRQVRNILIARLDNIGDVVMLSPALRAIKRGLPDVRLTLFASPAGTAAAPLLPEIDDVLTWRVVWQDVGGRMPFDPQREGQLIQTLRAGSFDAAIIFTSFSQTPYGVAYACYLAGIPLRLGQSKEFGGSLLSIAVPPLGDAIHQVERNLYLIEAAGFAVESRDLRLRVPADAAVLAAAKLEQCGLPPGRSYALLHPGASCAARSYPAARFAAVADIIVKQLGLPVVVTGAERERAVVDAVLAQMSHRPIVLAGQTTVPEWAALIRGARILLSNHTGSMHLADAFRTPSVILFSGSDLQSQWAPRHSPARLLQRSTPCSPCYGFTCPYHMECLDIPPLEVVAAVRDLLLQTASPLASQSAEGS